MSRPVTLEDFGTITPQAALPASTPQQAEQTSEAALSEAYERGYKAGWDDCLDGTRREQYHISEALGRRLSEVDISTEEIRASLLASLNPLLAEVFQKLLPSLAQTGFLEEIQARVLDIAKAQMSQQISILVSEEDVAAVEARLSELPDPPATQVKGDPALGVTQARLKCGATAQQIDIMSVVDGIENAFETLTTHDQEAAYG